LLSIFLLAACGRLSTQGELEPPPGDAAPPSNDGSSLREDAEASAADGPDFARDAAGSTPDAGWTMEAGAAAVDAGAPEARADAERPRFRACHGEWSKISAGKGCFCQGPFVRSGSLVYRASYELEVIDVSDLAAPRLVRTVPLARSSSKGGIAIVAGLLVVAGWKIEVFDLTDPTAPVSRGTISEQELTSHSVVTDGKRAYVTVSKGVRVSGELLVVDPTALAIQGRIGISGGPDGVAVVDHLAYVGTRDGEPGAPRDHVVVVDVGDPAQPKPVTQFDVITGSVLGPNLVARGSTLWIAGSGNVLLEGYDLRSRPVPVRTSSLAGSGVSLGIHVSDDLLFILSNQIAIVDIVDPRDPRVVGQLPADSDVMHSELIGDRLLVSNGNNLTSASVVCEARDGGGG
jgi:hypothetical protein